MKKKAPKKAPLCCIVNRYLICNICETPTCLDCFEQRDKWIDSPDAPSSNSPCRGCGEVDYSAP